MVNQVFISYRNESPEHTRAVRRLGELLRQTKIPVMLDQFFAEENPGGAVSGVAKWCEDCTNESKRVLVIASEGWFASYKGTAEPGIGLGSAFEAGLIRQALWDDPDNFRIRLVFLHSVAAEKVPVGLRKWDEFRLFESPEQFNQLIRWLADGLDLRDIEMSTVAWPAPVEFHPDLANRNKNKKEWPAIVDLLAGRSRERILLLQAESGLGKSEFVRQAAAYAKKLGIPIAPIELKDGTMTVEDILGQIDLELARYLPNFARDGGHKTHLLRKDLRMLRRPVLLMFDTFEDAAENKTVAGWLNQQLLAEVETSLSLLDFWSRF